jgi:hypothetical protein
MGLVHYTATVQPTKRKLARRWLASKAWASNGTTQRPTLEKVGEYRFDDPAGAVGVETILWRTPDGTVLQVPFTYRGSPLAGADAHLVGSMEHSVLGKRWVYDGCADPVWAATIATAILTGGTQAQMVIEKDGATIDVPPRIRVHGSGSAGAPVPAVTSVDSVVDEGQVTQVSAGGLTISLPRIIGTPVSGAATLTGANDDGDLGVLAAITAAG